MLLDRILKFLGFGKPSKVETRLDSLLQKGKEQAAKQSAVALKQREKIADEKKQAFKQAQQQRTSRLDDLINKDRALRGLPRLEPPVKIDNNYINPPLADERRRYVSAEEYFAGSVWTKVKSSNVDSIAYFPSVQQFVPPILAVRFHGGGRRLTEYWYFGVKIDVYTDMFVAASKGRFVWRRLRDRYPYRRVK